MLTHYMPALIMFIITLAVVTLLFVPATLIRQKNALIAFYWIGLWGFLGLIAAFAGGAETLTLLDVQARPTGDAFLAGLVAAFVLFVVFGWFRLCFVALSIGVRRIAARFG